MRTYLLALLVCLSLADETSEEIPAGYTKYETPGCAARNELGLFYWVYTVQDCADLCDRRAGCVSFEYDEAGNDCQLSTSCATIALTEDEPGSEPLRWYLRDAPTTLEEERPIRWTFAFNSFAFFYPIIFISGIVITYLITKQVQIHEQASKYEQSSDPISNSVKLSMSKIMRAIMIIQLFVHPLSVVVRYVLPPLGNEVLCWALYAISWGCLWLTLVLAYRSSMLYAKYFADILVETGAAMAPLRFASFIDKKGNYLYALLVVLWIIFSITVNVIVLLGAFTILTLLNFFGAFSIWMFVINIMCKSRVQEDAHSEAAKHIAVIGKLRNKLILISLGQLFLTLVFLFNVLDFLISNHSLGCVMHDGGNIQNDLIFWPLNIGASYLFLSGAKTKKKVSPSEQTAAVTASSNQDQVPPMSSMQDPSLYTGTRQELSTRYRSDVEVGVSKNQFLSDKSNTTAIPSQISSLELN